MITTKYWDRLMLACSPLVYKLRQKLLDIQLKIKRWVLPIMIWLFYTPTRIFEVFSTVLMWSFSIPFLIDNEMMRAQVYSGFVDRFYIITGFIALAAINTYCLTKRSAGSRYCAGLVMLLSALGWAIISAQFFRAWPPLSTAMTIYPCLSLFCFLVGFKNIHDSRTIENADNNS